METMTTAQFTKLIIPLFLELFLILAVLLGAVAVLYWLVAKAIIMTKRQIAKLKEENKLKRAAKRLEEKIMSTFLEEKKDIKALRLFEK